MKALEPGRAGAAHGQERQKRQPHLPLGSGQQVPTDQAFNSADVTVKQDIYLPRIHVASIETPGCVSEFDNVAED